MLPELRKESIIPERLDSAYYIPNSILNAENTLID